MKNKYTINASSAMSKILSQSGAKFIHPQKALLVGSVESFLSINVILEYTSNS